MPFRRATVAIRLVLVSLSLLALLFVAEPARADSLAPLSLLDAPVSFHAQFALDYEGSSYGGPFSHVAGRGRWDFSVNSQKQAVILRTDSNLAVILWPTQKWYVSTTLSEAAALAGGLDQANLSRTPDGSEMVDGEMCSRWKVEGTGFAGRIWLTHDGILMKGEGEIDPKGHPRPVLFTISHLERGFVDPTQFDPPQDWVGLPLAGLLKSGGNLHF